MKEIVKILRRLVFYTLMVATLPWLMPICEAMSGQAGVANELTLTTSTQERLEGVFTHRGVVVRFVLAKIPGKNAETFSLSGDNGKSIMVARISADASYSIRYYDRLTIENPALTNRTRSLRPRATGDRTAIKQLIDSSEYKVLPHLSRELAVRFGIRGDNYPISLPLHVMALSAARLSPESVPESDIEPGAEPEPACKDLRKDECKGCFGMCGNDCKCWSWVCGDCCCHAGCRAHDEACRDCRWNNPDPVACSRCAAFDLGVPALYCSQCAISCGKSQPAPIPYIQCGDKKCDSNRFKCCGGQCWPKGNPCP